MAKRTRTNNFVIHCSATRGVQDVGVKDIRKWHLQQGWSDIGYHFVIRRSGKLEVGRAVDTIGSHVKGHNATSIGICLAGGLDDKTWEPTNNFTGAQWETLKKLLTTLSRRYPGAKVLGHRDFPGVAKACPCFNARAWAKANGFLT